MAKVIGENPKVGRECSCQGCGAIIRYYKNDVREEHTIDYGGGTDANYSIKCPRCSNSISVKPWY